MMSSRSYYTLIASLPPLPPRFDVDRDPISAPRLEQRLRLLAEDDAAVIDQWRSFLVWDRQPLDRTDSEFIATYQQLMRAISNLTLRQMIQIRIDTRTIVCAVRLRRSGMPLTSGVGQWVDHIRRNYAEPEFNLAGRYSWIGEFNRLLADDDAIGAERLLFATNYSQWSRMAENYTFSFEAILLYLARWEIIDRWTSRNAEAGKIRFDSILTETLGDYAQLFKQ
jgi:Protein of unknown function (DUF2764)